jgi:hypothetical protein
MDNELLSSVDAQADAAVLAGARRLADGHHRNVAFLVAHVAVVDGRRLFAERHPSLFQYCRVELRLSEGAAANLIETARVARRFPLVLSLLQDGSINPTTVRVLSTSLSAENHADLLRAAIGRTKLEVQAMAARLRPAPDVPTTLRKVPAPPVVQRMSAASLFHHPAVEQRPVVAPPVASRPLVVPLAPARYSYKLTVDDEMRTLLQQAKELASHAEPSGDDLAILKRALGLFVEQQLKQRFGQTRRPRPAKVADPAARHVPAHVARVVYERDGGSCAYVSPDGRRCGERRFIQIHHVKAWMAGGDTIVGNLALRCRTHNLHEARLLYNRPPESGSGPGVTV